jgi:hypothetical protein
LFIVSILSSPEVAMGVFELWAVIKKKKFEPGAVKAIDLGSTYRLDLLSCLYTNIRQAFYSHTNVESAYKDVSFFTSLCFTPFYSLPSTLFLSISDRVRSTIIILYFFQYRIAFTL